MILMRLKITLISILVWNIMQAVVIVKSIECENVISCFIIIN